MDPFTIIAGLSSAIGLGAKLFGGGEQIAAQQNISRLNQEKSGYEQQINEQRRMAMNIDTRRRNLEMIRQTQLSNSLALTNASKQGAQFGSGLQGGYAQIQGQTGVNLTGLNQNYQIGNNIFDLNNQVSQANAGIASAQGQAGMGAGIGAIGDTMMKESNNIGNLTKTFFGPSQASSGWNFNLTGGLY